MHSDSLRLNNAAAALNGSADGSAHLNGLGNGLDGSAAQPMVLGEQPMLYAEGAAPPVAANGLVAPTITTGDLPPDRSVFSPLSVYSSSKLSARKIIESLTVFRTKARFLDSPTLVPNNIRQTSSTDGWQ